MAIEYPLGRLDAMPLWRRKRSSVHSCMDRVPRAECTWSANLDFNTETPLYSPVVTGHRTLNLAVGGNAPLGKRVEDLEWGLSHRLDPLGPWVLGFRAKRPCHSLA